MQNKECQISHARTEKSSYTATDKVFSKQPWDIVRGFLCRFTVIEEVWLPGVAIWTKIGYVRECKIDWATIGKWRLFLTMLFWMVLEDSLRCFIGICCELRCLGATSNHLIENLAL